MILGMSNQSEFLYLVSQAEKFGAFLLSLPTFLPGKAWYAGLVAVAV